MGEPKEPILEKLTNIQHTDAILRYTEDGRPYEPEWPAADFIIGNPPFLGGNKIRQELGDKYVDDLFQLYEGRVPAFADLVCYWFEKSRIQIAVGKTQRAGLLGTQGIRGGVNRVVLEQIKSSGDIFLAFSDRAWILDGANVHVSMVGFDDGSQTNRSLDGSPVTEIHADLTSEANMISAGALPENANLCFMGPSAKGPFDIDSETARKMLMAPLNVNGRPNSDVVRPVCSGVDLVQRNRHKSTIDFGMMSMEKAVNYEYPFEYVKALVYPVRTKGRKAKYGEHWWRYGRPRVEMRRALMGKSRYIATPATAKHRIFVWELPEVLCNQGTLVFARDDDYFFGILHSRLHEVWARQMGTQLREVESGFRYPPTSTFETFPFPWPPGQEPENNPRVKAIATAARELIRLRNAWLNPPEAPQAELKERTLTKLYNKRPAWLESAHEALDRAVFAAYGWQYPLDENEVLRHLLELNHERSAGAPHVPGLNLPPKKEPGVERLPGQRPNVKIISR